MEGEHSHSDFTVYFNQQVETILKKYGYKMTGWDETNNPAFSKDAVIQSWHGHDFLAEIASKGYDAVLSTGSYIDQPQPTSIDARAEGTGR